MLIKSPIVYYYLLFKTSTAYTDEVERLLLIIVKSSCKIKIKFNIGICIAVLRFTSSTSSTGLEKLSCAVY